MTAITTMQTKTPAWVLQKDCPESVIDALPVWKQAVIQRIEEYRQHCLTALETGSKGAHIKIVNLSFADYHAWAAEQARQMSDHVRMRYSMKIEVEKDFNGPDVTLHFSNPAGGSAVLKICLRP